MQNLYYIQASGSLSLVNEFGTSTRWSNIDALTISDARQQIIAESSSVEIAVFPVDGTNIYYNYDGAVFSKYPTTITSSQVTSNVLINFNIINADALYTASYGFSISGSYFLSASGYITEVMTVVPSDSQYTFKVTGSGTYTPYLRIYDTTTKILPYLPGVLLTELSASNQPVSASIYLSASHQYAAYIIVDGNYFP